MCRQAFHWQARARERARAKIKAKTRAKERVTKKARYKQEHPEQWWEFKPVKEILSMLSVLPLNAESYQEGSELVKCLHM